MKSSDIASINGFQLNEFNQFIKSSNFKFTSGFLAGINVDDSEVEGLVLAFNKHLEAKKEKIRLEQEKIRMEEERKRKEQEAIRQAEIDKQRALSQMLITSGFSFDGYTVKKYSGYISGDHAIQVKRGRESTLFGFNVGGSTNVGDALMASLTEMRRHAIAELKEAAYDLGCNAVIGVDFDYITLDPQTVNDKGQTVYLPYVFGVTANGNAVIIEKIKQG
jgi:uncharacterized protein YbjQ (UPF0145 family)